MQGQGSVGLRVGSGVQGPNPSAGCGNIVFLLLVSHLVREVGLEACAGFLTGGAVPVHRWVEQGLGYLVGRATAI